MTARQDKIDYIIEHRVERLARYKGLSADKIANLKSALAVELVFATDKVVAARYEHEQYQQARRQEKVRQDEERERFYNKPSSDAEFGHWAIYDWWSLPEATALVLGKDPVLVNCESLAPFAETSPLAEKFFRILQMAIRAEIAKPGTQQVQPAEFLNLARRKGFEVPAKLEELVFAHAGEDENSKARLARQVALENENTELKTKLAEAQTQLEELRKFVEKPLHEKERGTMQKLISALAICGYGFDPRKSRSPVIAEIDGDLAKLGMQLHPDTIRHKIVEACSACVSPEALSEPLDRGK
jgi:hypothetical protein